MAGTERARELQLPLTIDYQTTPVQHKLMLSFMDYWGELPFFDEGRLYEIIVALLSKSVDVEKLGINPAMSFSEYNELRLSHFTSQYVNYVLNENRRNKLINPADSFNQEILTNWVLSTTGILTPTEIEAYQRHADIVGYATDVETALEDILVLAHELSESVVSTLTREEKIHSPDEASKLIRELIREGKRVAIAFGFWDLKHEGHEDLLEEAKKLLGKNGVLFVASSPDVEAKLKDDGRPINPQRQRANSLARMNCVDYVIELPEHEDSVNLTQEYLAHHYIQLMTLLSPHFRIIGSIDESFDEVLRQCKESGVLLLYQNKERITDTTAIIRRILERYQRIQDK